MEHTYSNRGVSFAATLSLLPLQTSVRWTFTLIAEPEPPLLGLFLYHHPWLLDIMV